MDAGLAALLGAMVGAIGTASGAVLNSTLQVRREKAKERPAKQLLLQMLNIEALPWRQLSTLSNVIGTDKQTTTRLLLEISARGSETNGEDWTLIARNPLPITYASTGNEAANSYPVE
jgi:hypothetical protein